VKVEIKSKERNPLLERTEVSFVIENAEKTPSRKELREKLAALLGAKEENLVVGHIVHEFGKMQAEGSAMLYESQKNLEVLELESVQRKNFPEKHAKKEEKKE